MVLSVTGAAGHAVEPTFAPGSSIGVRPLHKLREAAGDELVARVRRVEAHGHATRDGGVNAAVDKAGLVGRAGGVAAGLDRKSVV